MFQKVTKSILSHGQALKAFSVSFLLEFKLFFFKSGIWKYFILFLFSTVKSFPNWNLFSTLWKYFFSFLFNFVPKISIVFAWKYRKYTHKTRTHLSTAKLIESPAFLIKFTTCAWFIAKISWPLTLTRKSWTFIPA